MRDPAGVTGLTDAQWDLLIRQARRADLLGRLHARLEQSALLEGVPRRPRSHLESARRVTNKHARIVAWEIRQIRNALAELGIPVVLLKGAAYAAAGLPPSVGRIFSDIDIMVPVDVLGRVEQRLMMHGWVTGKLNAYDQMYYRRWMHEIPPLTHRRRETVLDVHHNILPPTSHYRVDAESLFSRSIQVEGVPGLRMLAPEDMVLHCAAHLFCDGEFDHALRDLADFDDLVNHFGYTPDFLPALRIRASSLGLGRPLYYALKYRAQLFGRELPDADVDAPGGVLLGGLMDALFSRAVVPHHPSCNRRLSGLARSCLYVRGHYLRMPWYLLIPHLLRKSLRGSDD